MGMVKLGYSLQTCNIDWYRDYHVGNVCAERIGVGYTWVDIECVTATTETFDKSLKKALKHMFMKSHLDHVPRYIRDYWMSLKPILAELINQPDFLTHKTPALFAKIDDALQSAVPLPAPPLALFAKIGEASQGAVPLQAPWLEPMLPTEAASSSTTPFPWSVIEPRVCSETASKSTDHLQRLDVDLDSVSPNTEPQARSEEQFQPQAQSSGSKRSKTEASDESGENPSELIDGISAVAPRLKDRDTRSDDILVPNSEPQVQFGEQCQPQAESSGFKRSLTEASDESGENPADLIDGISAVASRLKNRDTRSDDILEIVARLKNELGVPIDAASSTSLDKSIFQAQFQDVHGNYFRYQPSATSIHISKRGPEAYRGRHESVVYDSVFLIVMLVWEQLRKEYKKPDSWKNPGSNNGYQCPVKFASKWSKQWFVPWIRGLSKDLHQVVDVVELAKSISECLEYKEQATDKDTGYLSWKGFLLKHFDSTVVGAQVAKLAFQYLPSLPFLGLTKGSDDYLHRAT
jgi:hypothetical protein